MRSKKHWRVALRGFACNKFPSSRPNRTNYWIEVESKGSSLCRPREIFLILLGNIVYGKTLDYSN